MSIAADLLMAQERWCYRCRRWRSLLRFPRNAWSHRSGGRACTACHAQSKGQTARAADPYADLPIDHAALAPQRGALSHRAQTPEAEVGDAPAA